MNVHSKVKAGSLAGAVSVLVVFFLDQVGVEVSAEVASAITTVVSFAAGYLKA